MEVGHCILQWHVDTCKLLTTNQSRVFQTLQDPTTRLGQSGPCSLPVRPWLSFSFKAVCACNNIRTVRTGFVVTNHGVLDVLSSQVELLFNLSQSIHNDEHI